MIYYFSPTDNFIPVNANERMDGYKYFSGKLLDTIMFFVAPNPVPSIYSMSENIVYSLDAVEQVIKFNL